MPRLERTLEGARGVILSVMGAAGLVNEAVLRDEPRLPVLLLATGLALGPAVLTDVLTKYLGLASVAKRKEPHEQA